VAEILAKKFKRGWGKNKVGRKNLWANFCRILPNEAEKGLDNIF
jgi:hypothetical protein